MVANINDEISADPVATIPSTVPSPPHPPVGSAWPLPRGVLALAFALFLVEALALQYAFGAFAMDFSALSSDEPAHYVTSLMVREYLTSGELTRPMAFASNYYLHYPKVAIGHWPPGFYAMLSAWMFAAGTSRLAALVLMAILAATLALATFAAGRALVAPWAGWFTGGLLLAMPLVRQSTAQVVYEHATSLFMLLAALQFARGMRTDRLRDWVGFALLASAGILTNASAWALGLMPAVALVLGRRLDLVRSPRMWASAGVVLVCTVPWYAATQSIRAEENALVGGGWQYVRDAVQVFPGAAATALGPVLTVAALIGLWTALWRPRESGRIEPVWACLAGLAAAKLALHIAVPAGLEARYVLAMLPALLLFAALGLDRAARSIGAGLSFAAPALAAVAVAPLAGSFIAAPPATVGYMSAATAVAAAKTDVPQAQLVVSDSQGEGAWIAAVAGLEPRPSTVVARGSKLFVVEDWLGRDTEERYAGADEVMALLDAIPVSVVVVDGTTLAGEVRGYHARVAAVVAASPAWERAGAYPVQRFGREFPEGLVVYRRRTPPRTPPDLERVSTLALRGSLRD